MLQPNQNVAATAKTGSTLANIGYTRFFAQSHRGQHRPCQLSKDVVSAPRLIRQVRAFSSHIHFSRQMNTAVAEPIGHPANSFASTPAPQRPELLGGVSHGGAAPRGVPSFLAEVLVQPGDAPPLVSSPRCRWLPKPPTGRNGCGLRNQRRLTQWPTTQPLTANQPTTFCT